MEFLPDPALAQASAHVRDLIRYAFVHPAGAPALLVYDGQTALARTLAAAYRAALPQAACIDFDTSTPEAVRASFAAQAPGTLVVLVQSTNFRLDGFRLRVELFKLGLKVIEHVHLARMPGEQGQYYIDSLAYDPAYYRGVGHALKVRLDAAQTVRVIGGGAELVFEGGFEAAKMNIGDYSGMANMGGQFPLGEVFTEARDLEAVHGSVKLHVFGDTSYRVNRPATPITLKVEGGRVVEAIGSTPAFDEVLHIIRRDEGEVWLRELGLGMNRAFSASRLVDDIGTYERMCGVHLSLGCKHGVYSKPGFKRKDARYHIDVFAQTEAVYIDATRVYADGAWQI
ncbi:hypothetical protein [Massilia sp. TS11]|uniref:hypothetical protein n=1 Tax=Massilia sp. TS11 TaxID=2908003 RepID=UPI001EDB9EE3|nr:hypothetical protein [Massilia sp. TS11]MCG2583693.1 hypothetical protein [Massilia sp. TS11]